jgi:hypothetical protein
MASNFFDLLGARDYNGSVNDYEIRVMGYWNVRQPLNKCRLSRL